MINGSENFVQKRLRSGGKVVAAWAQAASGITSEIMAAAGFDVIVVDMEHGPGGITDLIGQIQAMQGHPAVPFVRAPWNDPVWIKKILDAGVYGVHVPYVNTAEEARQAVAAVRYPPRGIRGMAGSPRGSRYGINSAAHLRKFDMEITLIIAIETPLGIDNLDAIMNVEGVDMIFIGPMDLATNMGHFADPAHPEVQEAIRTIERKAKERGIPLGSVASSWEDARAKYARGYAYLTVLSDTGTLAKAAAVQVENFRSAFAGRENES